MESKFTSFHQRTLRNRCSNSSTRGSWMSSSPNLWSFELFDSKSLLVKKDSKCTKRCTHQGINKIIDPEEGSASCTLELLCYLFELGYILRVSNMGCLSRIRWEKVLKHHLPSYPKNHRYFSSPEEMGPLQIHNMRNLCWNPFYLLQ